MGDAVWRRSKAWLARQAARRWRRPPLTPRELRELEPNRVLIVRQHNQMGDMVCATPAFRALRGTFPAAELVLVTAPINDAVVRHNPDLDRVLCFDKTMWCNPLRLIAFWRTLRAARGDVAFVLNSVSFSVTSAILALASGSRYVVGGDSRPFGWDISDAFSLVLPATPGYRGHAVDENLAPLASVGITTDDLGTVVVPAPQEVAEAQRLLAGWHWRPGYWMVHPGAGKRQNVWPAHSFAAVIQRAVAAAQRVLIVHGPTDRAQMERLAELLSLSNAGPVRVAPPVSLGVAAALLQQADRFLCNDTGIMHVAGAVGVPTVALFGPTRPEQWKPRAADVIALRSPRRTPDPRGGEYGWMENLAVDTVWEAWRDLPGRANPSFEA